MLAIIAIMVTTVYTAQDARHRVERAYLEGSSIGYDTGYSAGYNEGSSISHEESYNQGYYDAWGKARRSPYPSPWQAHLWERVY